MTKKVLIEEWLPIHELGAESKRERASASALPPVYFLHVWWARRPLVASVGVVLGSVMPAWSPALASSFPEASELVDNEAYQKWFKELCGIWGDPVAAQLLLAEIKAGLRDDIKGNGYGYKQAFRNSVKRPDIDLLRSVLLWQWGDMPLLVDSTAGGGTIPFVASRMGLPVVANDLNPVAASVLTAGVEIPSRFGASLVSDLEFYGKLLTGRVVNATNPYFPSTTTAETVTNYIFANAVRCPRTNNWTPLIKQRWLNKTKGSEAAIKFVTTGADGIMLEDPGIEIVGGDKLDFDPSIGTVKGGVGTSIYDNLAISSEHITREAQAGRMRPILVGVAIKTEVPTKTKRKKYVRGFRAPTDLDLGALDRAEAELARKLPAWLAEDIIPIEEIPEGNDMRPRQYGMPLWRDIFTARQLLVHGTFVEEFRNLIPEVRETLSDDPERADAVLFELGLMIGKAINWNSRLSTWISSRQTMRSVFDRHDFAFKWDFAEFQGADELYPWCLSQLTDAYGGIAALLDATGRSEIIDGLAPLERSVTVSHGNAADLTNIKDRSVALLCMDPPYHDNVMYAELSDYFYVWEKRTSGLIRPEIYTTELTDKDNEAVANKSRFKAFGRQAKELAKSDYERKMAAIFTESRRVLRDDGIFTLMFTHKSSDAWSALGKAVIEAGFVVETSWPISTESAVSLHQVGQASAASTIMLACRKRTETNNFGHSLQQVKTEIQQAVAETLQRCEAAQIMGVDQLLSTYGPALAVVSAKWPVYGSEVDDSGNANVIDVDDVLTIAAEEVVRIQRQRLFRGADAFDSTTDFVLLAWSIFRSREITFDDARKLAFSLGHLQLQTLEAAKIIANAKGIVTLVEPVNRLGKADGRQLRLDGADPNAPLIDILHAAIVLAQKDGTATAKDFLERTGKIDDSEFKRVVQALLDAMPRAKTAKGAYQLAEVGMLSEIGHLLSLDVPPDPVIVAPTASASQPTLDQQGYESEEEDGGEDEGLQGDENDEL